MANDDAGTFPDDAAGTFPDDAADPMLREFLPGTARQAVRLRLLGGFTVMVGQRQARMAPVAERLVAFLGLTGRATRSRAAGTLWPDSSEERAAACLRTGIWRVNQSVDGLVSATRSAVELAQGVQVDVRRYVSAATAGLLSDSRTPAAEVRATIGHDGELLTGWDDEWILAERERLRQLRLHLLEVEVERLAGAGSYGPALDAALAALAADPLRESVHRAIIGIHLAEGNPAEAHRAYLACRRALADDLGVEPSEATVRLAAVVSRPGVRTGRLQ